MVDARVLVATNQDYSNQPRRAHSASTLFFRLNEFTIVVPPLAHAKGGTSPYLAKIFSDTTNRELNKNVNGFSESAIEALIACEWPGNVRQLRSTIRRAVLPGGPCDYGTAPGYQTSGQAGRPSGLVCGRPPMCHIKCSP